MTKLVFAITASPKDQPTIIDASLGGIIFDVPGHGERFVVPFASTDNLVDCLRILLADARRHAEAGPPALAAIADAPPPFAFKGSRATRRGDELRASVEEGVFILESARRNGPTVRVRLDRGDMIWLADLIADSIGYSTQPEDELT